MAQTRIELIEQWVYYREGIRSLKRVIREWRRYLRNNLDIVVVAVWISEARIDLVASMRSMLSVEKRLGFRPRTRGYISGTYF